MVDVCQQYKKSKIRSAQQKSSVRQKKRALHVVPNSTRGGIFRVAVDLFQSFAQDDAFSLVAAVPVGRGEKESFPFPGKYVILERTRFRQFLALKRMAQQCDVIHLHGFTPWQALACWLARKKIVYTNHGLLGTGRKLRRYERLKLLFLKVFLRYAVHRIVHVSHFMQTRMISEYAVPAHRCCIVHNSTPWRARPPHFNPAAQLRIGFHGRFVSFKRIDRLLNVAAIVAQRHAVEVVLVGEGPLQHEIAAQATSLRLPLRFESYTLAVEALVSSFDVEIIASQDEPFGLSLLESIQTGHPTFVFTDGGGCVDIFDEEAKWFVCATESEMAEKIISLYQPKSKKKALDDLLKLQDRANILCSPAQFAASYKKIYLSVLEAL